MVRLYSGVSQLEEWSCAEVWRYSSRYFCICCQMAEAWTDCSWGECWLTFGLCADIFIHCCHCSVNGTSTVLGRSALLYCAVHQLCKFVMFPVYCSSTKTRTCLQNSIVSWRSRDFAVLFTRAVMCKQHCKLSVKKLTCGGNDVSSR